MKTLKLIDEQRIDFMIMKCENFLTEMKGKDALSQEELKFVLIMEGQLLAYKMIKQMELKVVPDFLIESLSKRS